MPCLKNIPGRVLVICVVVIGCSKIMPFDLESVLRFSCLKTFFVGGKEKCLMCELGKLKGLEVDFTDLEDVEADGKIGNLT